MGKTFLYYRYLHLWDCYAILENNILFACRLIRHVRWLCQLERAVLQSSASSCLTFYKLQISHVHFKQGQKLILCTATVCVLIFVNMLDLPWAKTTEIFADAFKDLICIKSVSFHNCNGLSVKYWCGGIAPAACLHLENIQIHGWAPSCVFAYSLFSIKYTHEPIGQT